MLKKSIAIQESQGQHIRIGSAYENLGKLYMDTDSLQQANFYFEKARKTYEVNNNTYDIVRLLLNTGQINKNQNRYKNAFKDFNQSLKYSVDGGFKELEKEALQKLAFLFEEQNDFKNAFTKYKEYVEVKDSILNEKNQASINELMIEFETEKKERQIAQQELDIAEKTLESRKKNICYIYSYCTDYYYPALFVCHLFANKNQAGTPD